MRQIVSLPREISYRSRVTAARNRSLHSHRAFVSRFIAFVGLSLVGPAAQKHVKCVSIPFRAYRIRLVIEYRISWKIITSVFLKRRSGRLYSRNDVRSLPLVFSMTITNYPGYSKLNNGDLF